MVCLDISSAFVTMSAPCSLSLCEKFSIRVLVPLILLSMSLIRDSPNLESMVASESCWLYSLILSNHLMIFCVENSNVLFPMSSMPTKLKSIGTPVCAFISLANASLRLSADVVPLSSSSLSFPRTALMSSNETSIPYRLLICFWMFFAALSCVSSTLLPYSASTASIFLCLLCSW